MFVRAFAQCSPQCRHIHRQVSFLDEAIRPDSLQQLTFFDQVAAVFYEHNQQVEGLGSERHRLVIAQKLPLFGNELEGTEFVWSGKPATSTNSVPSNSFPKSGSFCAITNLCRSLPSPSTCWLCS